MRRNLFCAVIVFFGASHTALAENYAQLGYASLKVKDDQSGLKFSGSGFALTGRYDFADLKQTPIFITGGLQSGSIKNNDLGVEITDDVKGYHVGLGYAWAPAQVSEVFLTTTYAHGTADASAPGFGSSSSNSDGVILAVGGHVWLNDIFKTYGEIGYDRFSHKTTGYEIAAGLEASVATSFRLFIEYDYSSDKTTSTSPSDTVKADVVGGGIKIPFGGRK